MRKAAREFRLQVGDDSDLAAARQGVREMGTQQGLSHAAIESLATAVTELGRNMLVYAGRGELLIAELVEGTRRGVVVTAWDSGPGIRDLVQAMIDGYSTGTGLGLGLPSAKRLVDEFEIDSKVGVGTRVTIRKWSATEARPARLLIVDDDERLAEALARLLRAYDVVVHLNAMDALARLHRGERFDVIVSDVIMPGMSGCDLYTEIQQLAPDQAKRVVFLTGGSIDRGTEEFVAAIGQPVLAKPFAAKELRAFIEKFLI